MYRRQVPGTPLMNPGDTAGEFHIWRRIQFRLCNNLLAIDVNFQTAFGKKIVFSAFN